LDEESKKRLEKKVKDLEDKLARITPDDRKPIPMPMIPDTIVKPLYATDPNPAGSTTVDTVSTFTDTGKKADAPEGMYYDPVTGKYTPIEPSWREPLSAEDVVKAKDEFAKMHGIDASVGESKPKMYRVPKTMIIDSHEKRRQTL